MRNKYRTKQRKNESTNGIQQQLERMEQAMNFHIQNQANENAQFKQNLNNLQQGMTNLQQKTDRHCQLVEDSTQVLHEVNQNTQPKEVLFFIENSKVAVSWINRMKDKLVGRVPLKLRIFLQNVLVGTVVFMACSLYLMDYSNNANEFLEPFFHKEVEICITEGFSNPNNPQQENIDFEINSTLQ